METLVDNLEQNQFTNYLFPCVTASYLRTYETHKHLLMDYQHQRKDKNSQRDFSHGLATQKWFK